MGSGASVMVATFRTAAIGNSVNRSDRWVVKWTVFVCSRDSANVRSLISTVRSKWTIPICHDHE